MASVGHLAIGMAAGRYLHQCEGGTADDLNKRFACMSLLASLPDLDVVGFLFGVSPDGLLGHRGMSHSVVIALALGALALTLSKRHRRAIVIGTAVAVSHGLIDLLTAQGVGVALLYPLTDRRLALGWHPVPVAPSGPTLFSWPGACATMCQLACFSPLVAYALRPRSAGTTARSPGKPSPS